VLASRARAEETVRSRQRVTTITACGIEAAQTWRQRWYMPILFMALMALGVFVVMGLMLFYAAYAEGHERKRELQAAAKNADHKIATIHV
jgi:hypothetical protein